MANEPLIRFPGECEVCHRTMQELWDEAQTWAKGVCMLYMEVNDSTPDTEGWRLCCPRCQESVREWRALRKAVGEA